MQSESQRAVTLQLQLAQAMQRIDALLADAEEQRRSAEETCRRAGEEAAAAAEQAAASEGRLRCGRAGTHRSSTGRVNHMPQSKVNGVRTEAMSIAEGK